MASPQAAQPDRFTGLPPGVKVGPLGQRFVAYLIDALLPTVLIALPVLAALGEGEVGWLSVVGALLGLAWAAVVWWQIATGAAGPGMRLMKLQLVGFTDGRPLGWARAFGRAVLLTVLTVTGLGLVLLVVYLVLHPRRQGWHDLVANGVVIRERMLAPGPTVPPASVPPASVSPGRPGPAPAADGSRTGDTSAPGRPKAQPVPVAHADASLVTAGAVSRESAQAVSAGSSAMAPPASASAAAGSARGATLDGPAGSAAPASAQSSTPAVPAPQVREQRQWVAVLDDGRELAVRGLLLLGRNPQPRPGEETAALVKLADQTRTVSKTHLSLELDGDDLVVVDRGSTNGSTVTWPDGRTVRCAADQPTPVPDGAVVSMGDHWFKARRS